MKRLSYLPLPVKRENSLDRLVENRSTYTLDRCELNLYETYQPSTDVNLVFDYFVFSCMLRGKKVVRVSNHPGFDYLPGESVVIPAKEKISIDFPEASTSNPTKCMALAIADELIQETLNDLNEH